MSARAGGRKLGERAQVALDVDIAQVRREGGPAQRRGELLADAHQFRLGPAG